MKPHRQRIPGRAACEHLTANRAYWRCPRCQVSKCAACFGETKNLLCDSCDTETKRKFLGSLTDCGAERYVDPDKLDAFIEKVRRA